MEANNLSTSEAVQVLIVPLQGVNLVIPQALVMEIQPVTEVRHALADSPAWCRGEIDWRGSRVPLLSIEEWCGLERSSSGGRTRRVAILKGASKQTNIGYYAIEIHSIPHPVRVSPVDIQTVDARSDCELFQQSVKVAGVYGELVDLDLLESRVVALFRPSRRNEPEA